MLKLTDVRKQYKAGDGVVDALKGISLEFRRSEFVSILGPSGCGKTTLLNIIGGLDQYSGGDLIINGKSTKDFSDRDWDTYRNHSVGFVFQSYNLIPHQTVLQNVEIALSLSGVGKAERKKRAKQALEKVGLANQIHKKPSEMSGGQMQRVAIARAIVNDPDIILADEPTGALDTETSIQVMEILKEISADRLVIMVTHNPDIAEKYSTRIIRMLDGVITSDTAPLTPQESEAELESAKKKTEGEKHTKKPTLSLATSFGLSLKNLVSKRGRTILTSFAGSIGIIGIALIYAVSQGTTSYIDTVQSDTLSSYPITLEAQSMDLTTLMMTFIGTAQSNSEHDNDAVYQKSMIYDLINALSNTDSIENDLKSFKSYIESENKKEDSVINSAISGVQYTYDFDMLVYTENVDGEIMKSDSEELMRNILLEYFGMDMSAMLGMSESFGFSSSSSSMPMMSMGSGSMQLWQQMLPGDNGDPVNDMIKNQYDIVYGSWPNSYNEIVLVLDENNELDDMALYALGLKSGEEIDKILEAALNKTEIEKDTTSWTYEEICDMDFRVVLNSQCYTKDETTGTYTDLRKTNAGLKYLYDNGIDLHVVGIIKPNGDSVSSMLTGSIAYTSMLTDYVMEQAKDSEAVKEQIASPSVDIFTGLPFKDSGTVSDEQKVTGFNEYIASLDDKGKADAYIKIMSEPTKEQIDDMIDQSLAAMSREDFEKMFVQALTEQMGMSEDAVKEYVAAMSDEDIENMFSEMMTEQFRTQYAEQVKTQMASVPTDQLVIAFDIAIEGYTDEQRVEYYDLVLDFSGSDYDKNMTELGYVDPESPSTINIYATDFENKDVIEQAILDYNDTVDEFSKITYTDYVGLMMSSVTTIINAITYVLIAFVAVSLIVSSIMIGVITLISVQERTKEIGILRAIGASKKNVSGMFNAETMIIGFTSGALGVIITYLLCIPINIILHHVTGINNLSAHLPLPVAIALVIISVLLTLISGIIPSKSAAKKDPVVALRSE